MGFEIIDGVRTLSFDMMTTAALAGVILILGQAIRKKVNFFEKFCIPAAVIGGLIVSIVVLIFRNTNTLMFNMNTDLQVPFMQAFFTCVGFGGSIKLLKKGGKTLIIFLASCWLLAIIQNFVGVGLAKVLEIEPVLGVMAGAVSLVGGHGNAAAFGPLAENTYGIAGAMTTATASATFGLVLGGLIGGPVSNFLMRKGDIAIETEDVEGDSESESKEVDSSIFLSHFVLVLVFSVGGLFIAKLVDVLGIKNFALPSYVGSMFLAIIFRNINDKFNIFKLNQKAISIIQDVGLGMFLTMAIMTMKIWELIDLAVPIIVILTVQTIVVILFSILVLFKLLGRNYDSVVLTSGFAAWGLGITATGVAIMDAVCEKYKKISLQAFLIAPLCFSVFVDIVAIPAILWFLKVFS